MNAFTGTGLRKLNIAALLGLGLLLGACTPEQAPAPQLPRPASPVRPVADLVLRGGETYTMDAARSWAEAVAIRNGRILFAGDDSEVEALIGAETQVVDLAGKMVLPGMQDVHIHPIGGGMEAAACNLNGLKTSEQYLEAIRRYAESHPDEAWITGGGWLMSAFGPGAMPGREILDAIVADRPVFLSSSDGHTAWANSKALEIAGITRDTPDPVDGRIDRDPASGEPIGSLQEGARALVAKHVPAPSAAQRLAGLRYSVAMLNGYGVTGMQDAHVSEADLETYETLDANRELSLHVVAAQWWERDQGLEQIAAMKTRRARYTRGHVRATTVKIMQDGVMENYTAAMLEPYLIEGEVRGIPMVEPEFLKEAVTALDAEGFQVHFHAIGDAAVRQCLDAVQSARENNGALGHRHHIAHLQLIDAADIPRFRQLDVIANFQPLWAWADDYITELTIPFIGAERASRMYPIGSLHDSGAMIAFGSDWSVSTANPFEEIEVAVRRADPELDDGDVFVAEQRIDLPEALAAFTIDAAYTNGMEHDAGSLEAGKYADLVVLDRNLFTIDVREISEAKALLTLFEGEPVHGSIDAL
ncbi:MAG: amidohydrolase [Gammaproteobacteria bacterium]|nr:amidohydrolase [Gammaproteobacteria bacterium]